MTKKMFVFALSALALALPALAMADVQPWQINLQEAHSPTMHSIRSFHDILIYVCFGISALVLFLLAYVCLRFNKKANPKPSKTSHNTLLEVAWTTIPVIILVALSIPSFRLLYFMDKTYDADMTLKVIGYQWYWGYEYPDHEGLAFESRIIRDTTPQEDITTARANWIYGQNKPLIRLLETENRIVLPVDTNIRILITAADVIHAWAIPSLGLKMDAVPGRLNETWVRIDEPGVYRGQCSELCGPDHGFMPIVIEAVTKEEFNAWVAHAKERFAAANDNEPAFHMAQAN